MNLHLHRLFGTGFLCCGSLAVAQSASAPQPFVEELRQQERERALREQQQRSVDARLSPGEKPQSALLPSSETPCVVVDRLILEGRQSEAFDWSLAAATGDDGDGGPDSPEGRCLGTQGIDIIVARVQRAIVDRGYTTTRVLAGRQDLSTGVLVLTVIPGRVSLIRSSDGAVLPTSLRHAIPVQPGDLLNLRDIEQGLENLRRLPTAQADIQIEPSKAQDAQLGDSDLIVNDRQRFPLRTTLSLDDSGTEATGKTQSGLTVAWDGPLGLSDLAYVSLNHDAFNHAGQGTRGQTLHYSIPYGYWLVSFTGSQSRYRQSVAGLTDSYVYSGVTRHAEMKLSRLIYRDQRRKTTVSIRGFRRASNNFIDDTEVEVQRRVVGGWEGQLNHREFVGDATLDGTLAYRRGTGAFGAMPAPEEVFGEGTSRLKLYSAELNLNAPFTLGGQTLRYSALWRAQWNRTPLTPQDRFSIGGRYTVRGFDGESSLMSERGWLVRHDLGLALGQTAAELYVGIDHGEVGGPSVQDQLGRRLVGGVLGLRGAWSNLSYDLFVGAPIKKPEGYRTAKVACGVNLNYSF